MDGALVGQGFEGTLDKDRVASGLQVLWWDQPQVEKRPAAGREHGGAGADEHEVAAIGLGEPDAAFDVIAAVAADQFEPEGLADVGPCEDDALWVDPALQCRVDLNGEPGLIEERLIVPPALGEGLEQGQFGGIGADDGEFGHGLGAGAEHRDEWVDDLADLQGAFAFGVCSETELQLSDGERGEVFEGDLEAVGLPLDQALVQVPAVEAADGEPSRAEVWACKLWQCGRHGAGGREEGGLEPVGVESGAWRGEPAQAISPGDLIGLGGGHGRILRVLSVPAGLEDDGWRGCAEGFEFGAILGEGEECDPLIGTTGGQADGDALQAGGPWIGDDPVQSCGRQAGGDFNEDPGHGHGLGDGVGQGGEHHSEGSERVVRRELEDEPVEVEFVAFPGEGGQEFTASDWWLAVADLFAIGIGPGRVEVDEGDGLWDGLECRRGSQELPMVRGAGSARLELGPGARDEGGLCAVPVEQFDRAIIETVAGVGGNGAQVDSSQPGRIGDDCCGTDEAGWWCG